MDTASNPSTPAPPYGLSEALAEDAVSITRSELDGLRASLARESAARAEAESQLATYKLEPNDIRATNDRLRASNSALNIRATQAEAILAAVAKFPAEKAGLIRANTELRASLSALRSRLVTAQTTLASTITSMDEATDTILDLQSRLFSVEQERDRLKAFARDIATNYDHDERTRDHAYRHGYGSTCRVCEAERALSPTPADTTSQERT